MAAMPVAVPAPQRLPRPADFARKGEPAPQSVPAVVKPAQPALEPERPAGGNKLGMVTIVLIAVVAGVVAFFLSKLIPI